MADGGAPHRRTAVALRMASFAHEFAAATRQAFATAPKPVTCELVIAGIPIRLRATDADVLTEFSIALNHHTRTHPAVGDGATQINIWSASATGVTRPTMPADLRDRVIARRADLAPGADHHFDFDPAARMLTVMDPSTGRVDVCVNNLAELPQWETAAPLRSALGWILRRHDRHFLHAAAVCDDNGNAALLLGAGGAGKSTTSLRCRQAGMGFLGDDICAVSHGAEPDVFNVYGTAKALWSDHGRFPDLTDLLITDPADFGYKAVYAVNRSPDSRLVDRAKLRVLILVDRTLPLGTVIRANPARAVMLVATTTTSFLPGGGRPMLTALADVARRLPVLRMSLGEDPEAVAAAVSAVIRDPEAALRGIRVN